MESVVLSLAGGILGIIFGLGSSYLITQTLGWPVLISPIVIALTVLFSMTMGVFFGFYPARRAAQLDPIEALRYEESHQQNATHSANPESGRAVKLFAPDNIQTEPRSRWKRGWR